MTDIFFRVFLVIYSALCLIYLVTTSHHHDYHTYTLVWLNIFNEGKITTGDAGAYGPLFYFFYLPYAIKPFMPRVIFFVAMVLSVYHLHKNNTDLKKTFSLLLFLVSPVVLYLSVKYGNNDTFLAGLLLFSFLTYYDKNYLLSGFLLGLSVSFKFVPALIILPLVLSLDLKKALSFTASILLTFITITVFAHFILDYNILGPITFGVERESKLFSIFRFLRGAYSFTGNLDSYNVYFLLLGNILLSIYGYLKRWDWPLFVFILYAWTLASYKVLHVQFFIPFYLTALFLYFKDFIVGKPLIILLVIHLVFVSLYQLGYDPYGNYWGTYSWVRDIVGLPMFVINILILVYAIIEENRNIQNKKRGLEYYSP